MPSPPSPESVPATGGSRIAHQTMYKSAAIGIFMTKISQNMAQKLDTWRMVPGMALAANRPGFGPFSYRNLRTDAFTAYATFGLQSARVRPRGVPLRDRSPGTGGQSANHRMREEG